LTAAALDKSTLEALDFVAAVPAELKIETTAARAAATVKNLRFTTLPP
jgi:hypothetical protein